MKSFLAVRFPKQRRYLLGNTEPRRRIGEELHDDALKTRRVAAIVWKSQPI